MAQTRKNALISVFDKKGIESFAKELVGLGWTIYASGGTAKVLAAADVPVIDVATVVGEPMLEHRVVTLSRELHAGLLAAFADANELEKRDIAWIDLVCVDMYPLEAEIARPGATLASVIEKTDIGGPTMLRSGAKGQRIVVCDPADRASMLARVNAGTADDLEWRESLAAKAEAVVADYVLASARYRGKNAYDGVVGTRVSVLKYGENARQAYAGLFVTKGAGDDPFALDTFRLIEGTAPSYVNMTDLDCLVETITRAATGFKQLRGTVPLIMGAVKHGNFCGMAVDDNPHVLSRKVVWGDYEALSGGIVMATCEIDAECVEILRTHYAGDGAKRVLDSVIAPSFTQEAIEDLARKNGKCRLFVNPALASEALGDAVNTSRKFRQVRGGFMVQDGDGFILPIKKEWNLLPLDEDNLMLAWAIGSTGNSNSIVLTKDRKLIGSGMGQRSRVVAAELALLYAKKYKHDVAGAFAYSDSFFPFTDGPEVLANAGVKKIFATSGSIRDKEVLAAMQKLGVQFITLPDTEARGFAKH